MNKHFNLKKISAACFLSSVLFSCPAFASYYQQFYQDINGLGTANAGAAVATENASVQYANPAGLTKLKGPQVIVAGYLGMANIQFNGTNTYTDPYGNPVVSTGVANSSVGSLVPKIFYGSPINNQLAFGFSLTSPLLGKINYANSSSVRYSGTNSELQTIDFSPSLGYKLNDKLSIGLGLDVEYFRSTINYMTSLSPYPLPDASVTSNANDWRYGFHTGVLFDMSPATKMGIGFRSQIIHHPTGNAEVSSLIGNYSTTGFTYDAVSPATTTVSLSQAINQQLTLMGTVNYSNWKAVDKVVYRNLPNPGGPQGTSLAPEIYPQNFKNTWRLAVGSSYKVDAKWLLRAGVAYDQSPAPQSTRYSQLPDANSKQVSLGAHYQVTKNVGLDGGYTHIFVDKNNVNFSNAPLAETNGTVNIRGDLIGLQVVCNI